MTNPISKVSYQIRHAGSEHNIYKEVKINALTARKHKKPPLASYANRRISKHSGPGRQCLSSEIITRVSEHLSSRRSSQTRKRKQCGKVQGQAHARATMNCCKTEMQKGKRTEKTEKKNIPYPVQRKYPRSAQEEEGNAQIRREQAI